MPYVLDTATSKDRPSAASQAANTSKIIGIILIKVACVVRIVIVINTNRESINPSRHRSDDIRCDRYISRPRREIINANIVFIQVRDILIIVKYNHNLMSRNHLFLF